MNLENAEDPMFDDASNSHAARKPAEQPVPKPHKEHPARSAEKPAEHKKPASPKNSFFARHVFRLVVVIVVILLLYTAWGRLFPSKDNARAASVLVTVNGEPITGAQLDSEYGFFFFARGYPAELQGTFPKESFLNSSMVSEVLLLQEAKKQGVAVSDADVDALISLIVSQSSISLPDLERQLKAAGFDLATFREFYRKQLAIARFLNGSVISNISVSDAEVSGYYRMNRELFSVPEQVRLSHIMVNTTEEAQTILLELRSGASFSELARKYSLGSSAAFGGDLGFISRGMLIGAPEFEDAAFRLGVGNLSGVVKTADGFNIIKVTDKSPARNISLDEAGNDIRKSILAEKQTAVINSFLKLLRSRADIRWLTPAVDVQAQQPARQDIPVAESSVQENAVQNTPVEPQENISVVPPASSCIGRFGISGSTVIVYYADWCSSCKAVVDASKSLANFRLVEEKGNAVITECFSDVVKLGFPQLICAGSRQVLKTTSASDVEPFAKACLAQ